MDGVLQDYFNVWNTVKFNPVLTRDSSDISGPLLVCLLKNEAWRMPCFLEHYRRLGVKLFIFIDNNSTDNTVKILESQPDVDVHSYKETYSALVRQVIHHRILNLYGYDKWYLLVDADEFLVYDGQSGHFLDELTALAEKNDLKRVRAMMIDVYADCPVREYFHMDTCAEVIKQCVYFDMNPDIYETKIGRYVSIKGGAREQIKNESGIYSRKNELSKTPLLFFEKGDIPVNSHYHRPHYKNYSSECILGLLHYKFSRQDFAGLEMIAENNNDERGKGIEAYLAWIHRNSERNLRNSTSVRYISAASLINAGFLKKIEWNAAFKSTAILNVSLKNLRDRYSRKRILKKISWKLRELCWAKRVQRLYG